MDGFKILRDSRVPAAHLRARCSKTGRDFLIRLEYEKSAWWMVYATEQSLPPPDQSSSGGTKLSLEDGLYVGDDYACPYCGNRSIVRCGSCGRITCVKDRGNFICGYCGNFGEIKGYITDVQVERQPGGKK